MRNTDIGCVSAHAHLRKGVASYYEIIIRRPTGSTRPRFAIRLPNAQVIEQASLTYDVLSRCGFEDIHRDYQPPYSRELAGNGSSFLFADGTLVEMRVFQTKRDAVGIGREDANQFYTFL